MRSSLVCGAIVLALAAAPAVAQPSWVQRCTALPRAAEPGLVEFCNGVLANSGTQGQQDHEAALRDYRRAAELGNAEAQAVLGVAYEHGYASIRPDLATAVAWYEKAAAQGHPGAELNLGQLYAKGLGVPRDPARARQLIAAAAAQGLGPAQRALAELDAGGPAPVPGAALWQQAMARYNAGDHAGAALLVRQAAEAGHPTAIYEMGYLYENGDGVPKNPAEAARWYQLGASKGEPAAEAALGKLYEDGKLMPDDWVEAARWYQRSAQQDNPTGQYQLGRAYQYGIGVPVSRELAIGWYDKAAAQGNGQAAFFAKYLRDNHGFDGSSRTPEEQAILGPLLGRMIPELSPTGMMFTSSRERLAYVRAVASGEARAKQQMAHDAQQREYDDCRRNGGDNCHPPTVPAPR